MSQCDSGWHVLGDSDAPTYFRFAARMGGSGTLIYRVGSVPDDRECTTIWCYGDKGVPWTCAACGRSVGEPLYPLSTLAKRRDREGLNDPHRTGPDRAPPCLRRPGAVTVVPSTRRSLSR
jgi:hypothetical protein